MNKLSLYILLVLIFLGLSKSFSPSEHQTSYIANEKFYDRNFSGFPMSIILVDSFYTGFIIKTYYHRYKLVHAFAPPDFITVRTSKEFWTKNFKNLGMSLFRRKSTTSSSTVPLPPGSLYIGDPSYGTWVYLPSGEKVWEFHRAYRHFPNTFYWKDFAPDDQFHTQMKAHLKNNQAFYGINNEFGESGSLTSQFFKNGRSFKKSKNVTSIRDYLYQIAQPPQWNRNN